MTEFSQLPDEFDRLFQTVDFALRPQHEIVSQSLSAWRKARGTALLPCRLSVGKEQSRASLANSLVASEGEHSSDFHLCSIGDEFCRATGLEADSRHLSEIEEPGVALRLRRVFALALEREEPALVRFDEAGNTYEVFAAPISFDDGRRGIWCTLAAQNLPPSTASD